MHIVEPDIVDRETEAEIESLRLLTDLCDRAARGEIRGVMCVIELTNGDYETVWTDPLSLIERLGMVELIKAGSVSELLEEDVG